MFVATTAASVAIQKYHGTHAADRLIIVLEGYASINQVVAVQS